MSEGNEKQPQSSSQKSRRRSRSRSKSRRARARARAKEQAAAVTTSDAQAQPTKPAKPADRAKSTPATAEPSTEDSRRRRRRKKKRKKGRNAAAVQLGPSVALVSEAFSQIERSFLACPRCSYFFSACRALYGVAAMESAIEMMGGGGKWLALWWHVELRKLVAKIYGSDGILDGSYYYDGMCPLCQRAFVYHSDIKTDMPLLGGVTVSPAVPPIVAIQEMVLIEDTEEPVAGDDKAAVDGNVAVEPVANSSPVVLVPTAVLRIAISPRDNTALLVGRDWRQATTPSKLTPVSSPSTVETAS